MLLAPVTASPARQDARGGPTPRPSGPARGEGARPTAEKEEASCTHAKASPNAVKQGGTAPDV